MFYVNFFPPYVPQHPFFSPILLSWPRQSLALMPPTLVITDERDVLRSQGQQFAANLEAAGVPTTSTYYAGVMHEFFGASAVLDKAEAAQQQAADHRRHPGMAVTPTPTTD